MRSKIAFVVEILVVPGNVGLKELLSQEKFRQCGLYLAYENRLAVGEDTR